MTKRAEPRYACTRSNDLLTDNAVGKLTGVFLMHVDRLAHIRFIKKHARLYALRRFSRSDSPTSTRDLEALTIVVVARRRICRDLPAGHHDAVGQPIENVDLLATKALVVGVLSAFAELKARYPQARCVE